jgi:hypothetical protein
MEQDDSGDPLVEKRDVVCTVTMRFRLLRFIRRPKVVRGDIVPTLDVIATLLQRHRSGNPARSVSSNCLISRAICNPYLSSLALNCCVYRIS